MLTIDKKIMDKYAFEFDKKKVWDAPYTYVHSFDEIGWPSVIFENETWLQNQEDNYNNKKTKSMISDSEGRVIETVYPREKFNENFSPLCTYIPTNKLLIQIMRTCMFIEKEEDLLYNINNEPKKPINYELSD